MNPLRALPVLLLLSPALAAQEDLGALLGQARVARDQGKFDQALKAYDAMLAIVPAHETALLERAQTLAWAGRYPEALEGYRTFRERYPQRALDADLRIAQVHAWAGRVPEALSVLDPWVRLERRQAVLDDATYRAWEGRLGESLQRLSKWLELHPDDSRARNLRARFLGWEGRQTEAARAYEASLAADPGDGDALMGLARLRLWAGDPSGAGAYLSRLSGDDAQSQEAQVLFAQREADEGAPFRARARLRPLLAGGPGQRDARSLLDDLVDADGPWLEFHASRTDTSEELRTEDPGLQARVPLGEGHLDLGATRHRILYEGQEVDPTETDVAWSGPLGSRWRVNAGLQQISGASGPLTGQNAGLDFRALPQLDLRLDYARSPFLYTPQSVEDRGSITTLDLGAAWTPEEGLDRLEGGLGRGDVSAGSRRTSWFAAAERRFPLPGLDLRGGVTARGFRYSETLPLGFFNPTDYLFYGITAGAGMHQGRIWALDLDGRAGWQKVEDQTAQFTWGAALSASWNPEAWPVAFRASFSQSVAGLPVVESSNPSAYREHTLALAVRLRGPASWNLLGSF